MRSVVHMLMTSSTSKHKDEAFKAMMVATSPEVQTAMTRQGRVTALKDPKIREVYSADLEVLKGKNTAAVFKNTPAPNP